MVESTLLAKVANCGRAGTGWLRKSPASKAIAAWMKRCELASMACSVVSRLLAAPGFRGTGPPAGFQAQARHRGFQRGARQTAGLACPIEARRESRIALYSRMKIGVAHRLEIGPIGVQQARQRFRNLCAFPGGPDAVRGQGAGSAHYGEQRPRRH